jgi:hypothetical protein
MQMADNARQDNPPQNIRLIALDFDHTIVNWSAEPLIAPELIDALRAFRDRGGLWAVNSGRTVPQIQEGLELLPHDAWPDYLIAAERSLHRRTGSDSPADSSHEELWEDVHPWNQRCVETHQQLAEAARPLMAEFARHVRQTTNATLAFTEQVSGLQKETRQNGPHGQSNDANDETQRGFHSSRGEGRPPLEDDPQAVLAGFIAESEQQMLELCEHLDKLRRSLPDLAYQRNSIYLRFCHRDYNKGTALEELASLLGIPHQQVLAMGDNHNDLGMLNGSHGFQVACPSNAIDLVKRTVGQNNGYVATAPCSEGVVQALRQLNVIG